MTSYLIDPPAEYIIPVTRGADRAFTIARVDDAGAPVDFGDGDTVYMWIDVDDPSNPTRVDAVVAGSFAAFVLPSTVLDLIYSRGRWRTVWNQAGLETPLIVGKFERHDG